MDVVVRRYRPADLPELVAAAAAVAGTDVPYPPPEAGPGPGALTAWLNTGAPYARWVAVTEGGVIGHVQVGDAPGYLTAHLTSSPHGRVDVEVGRLFVDPAGQGAGAGRALVDTALRWARGRGLRCGLAVIDGSMAAQSLYRRVGMVLAGSFTGVHGRNHVYVDPDVPTAPPP